MRKQESCEVSRLQHQLSMPRHLRNPVACACSFVRNRTQPKWQQGKSQVLVISSWKLLSNVIMEGELKCLSILIMALHGSKKKKTFPSIYNQISSS